MRSTRITFVAVVSCVTLAGFLLQNRVDHLLAQAPPASSAPAARGQEVYKARCVECHGPEGKGDGPAAHLLTPRPRDFTQGKYKIRSTESGSVPTDDDLLRSVRQGLYGSAMPAWEGVLSDGDISAVVGYIKTLAPRFASEKPAVIPAYVPPPAAPARRAPAVASDPLARGLAAYEKLQCGKCHGMDGRGTGAVTTTFEDDWRQPLRAADLTEPWTYHGGATTADIYMRFRAGMSGTPMPSFKDAATDAEMWDLSAYVVSLARKPVWEMNAEEAAAFYAKRDAENKANPVKRGQYLVETMGCTVCHTAIDQNKRAYPGMYLAGGVKLTVEPFGVFVTGNLTSDKETGLGNWTDAEIKNVITRGTLRDGTRLLPFPMDWAAFATMPAPDLDAIVAYLRTVPAVHNKVPPPRWKFLPLYLVGKFNMLIIGSDLPFTFHTGNGGDAKVGGAR